MSILDLSPTLADLESRAGASDKDRDAWLAQRAGGVTATEVRDVMLAANREVAIRRLVKKKREGDSFTGTAYTAWGKDREPVIADLLAGRGVQPETRVFHAEGNSRFFASPDGLSVTFDDELELHEIKTSGEPLLKGSPELVKSGYEWQMQWQVFVLGAARCYLHVEQRLGGPGQFSPGELTSAVFERDEEKIAELVKVADQILAALDAEPEEQVIDEQVDTLALNYLRGLAAEKEGKALKEDSYRQLIERGVSQESAIARVTITPAKPAEEYEAEEIDLETAQAENAELWQQLQDVTRAWGEISARYTKTVVKKKSVVKAKATITEIKGKKK